jgi:hypothetical protein
MSGRDAAFGPGETPDAEGESGPPSHYPTFENPDVLVSWDGSRAAWAYLAQLELRDDCLITAASRLYPHVEDWGLVSRLMEFAGWGDSEDLERFIGENLEAIEARLRAAE